MKDLILLVADKNMKHALKGVLARNPSLGIRPIRFEIKVHEGAGDGGTRKSGPEVLALLRRGFRHALLVLDFEGCGSSLPNALALESDLDSRLNRHWGTDAKSIVIEPELDVWVWGSNNSLETALGWPPGSPVRQWLLAAGFTFTTGNKPVRPKEALQAVQRHIGTPRSSALYEQIAGKISLKRCSDLAFHRLKTQLAAWFPA